MAFHSELRGHWAAIVLGAGWLLLAAPPACVSSWVVKEVERPALLPAEVDSLVPRPFENAARVEMNAAELALLDKHLAAALNASARVRTFPEPPTRLPNSAWLAGVLNAYRVDEQAAEGFTLRTIELEAALRVLSLEDASLLVATSRRLSYQKVYPAGSPLSALELDLENAVRELAGELAAALLPGTPEAPIVLWDARDPLTGDSFASPTLVRGNRYAVGLRFRRARLAWQQVLFDPGDEGGERRYRVTERTLGQLRQQGVSEGEIARLAPLASESALGLVDFRRMLRERLDGGVEQEGLILTLSDQQADILHMNTAAAHANLASFYRLEKRYDLTAFHLARAYAHDPRDSVLSEWVELQKERQLNPAGLPGRELLDYYLRIPPPHTAQVIPGRFDRTVTPEPGFPGPQEASTAGVGPVATGSQPPPAQAPGVLPTAGEGAAGGGPGGIPTQAAPVQEAAPAPAAAPQSQSPGVLP
jgi:hypothetical protein